MHNSTKANTVNNRLATTAALLLLSGCAFRVCSNSFGYLVVVLKYICISKAHMTRLSSGEISKKFKNKNIYFSMTTCSFNFFFGGGFSFSYLQTRTKIMYLIYFFKINLTMNIFIYFKFLRYSYVTR